MKRSGELAVGLGSVALDIIGKVDQLPKEDGFCMVGAQQILDGGSCANVMTQIAHLGVPSSLIARVGDDEIGSKIVQGLRNEGIDTAWMMSKPGGMSLTTHIYVDPKGAKTIVLYMGDSLMNIDIDDIDLSFLDECKVFYTDLFPPHTDVAVAKAAKSKDVPVVFNMQTGWSLMEKFGADRDLIKEMLRYTEVFAPCQAGAYELTGVNDPVSCIGKIRSDFDFDGIIVLTLGSKGSLIDYNGRLTKIPAYRVKVVDTTGAGDSYIGAFIYAYYYARFDLETSGKFASAAAALTCTRFGARSNPTIEEVNGFDEWR